MGHSSATPDLMLENEMTKDWNGNDQVMLRSSRGASVKVSLHGGQVTSWRNNRGEELLFTSSKALFKSPKAMRGGIPICFPQFGNCGALEQHGFARTKVWTIDENPPPLYPYNKEGKSSVDLLLKSSDEDLKSWPYSFEFRLRVSLGADGKLTLISRVRNINGKPFSFSFAYHTYLSVSDISEVRIEGLETLDNLCQKKRCTAQGDAITFEAEVERVYVSSPSAIAVLDHEKKRTFLIRHKKHMFPSTYHVVGRKPSIIMLCETVVWNLWEKKAKSMLDFGDDEYKQMLCVDAAAIERPITLKPGEEWTGFPELTVVDSTNVFETSTIR